MKFTKNSINIKDSKDAENKLKVFFSGDFCPYKGSNLENLIIDSNESPEKPFGNIIRELHNKDLSFCNLELPLSYGEFKPIIKDGPAMIGSPEILETIKAGRFDGVLMANNHVMDYGEQPFLETLNLLEKNDITAIGAGRNSDEASQLKLFEKNGIKLGVLAFCEYEFSISDENSPGSAHFAPGPVSNIVRQSKEICDILIVSIHGGSEICPFPSPRMIRDYRSVIDAGATAVIGHHPHVVQGIEIYKDSPIVYSLGNFMFWEGAFPSGSLWWEGMSARLTFSTDKCIGLEIVSHQMNPETAMIESLEGKHNEAFFSRLQHLSDIITDPEMHKNLWETYCLGRLDFYTTQMDEFLKGIKSDKYYRNGAANLLNMFRCEAHHDVITTALALFREDKTEADQQYKKELEELLSYRSEFV